MNVSSHINPTNSRREKILELVRQNGFVSIPDLREALDVSESTIRRDLEVLEENGDARRTHGGVFSTGPSSSVQQFRSKSSEQWEKKRQIAELAARCIEDHETVLLDGGSTTYELARQLVGRPLQIVTNSLPVANLFASSDSVDLVLLGGAIHHKTGVTLGSYANEMLQSLNVQKAFLSVAGINAKGFYNSNMLLVETERAMMRCADKAIVLVDSTKFGRSSLAKLCSWSDVHALISDNGLAADWIQMTREAGMELWIAGPESTSDRSIAASVSRINSEVAHTSMKSSSLPSLVASPVLSPTSVRSGASAMNQPSAVQNISAPLVAGQSSIGQSTSGNPS